MHDFTKSNVLDVVKKAKTRGEKVVFTNGCFDILHIGHIRYLSEARALGGILIVGVNSDRSVRGLKGPTRPVNNERDRAELLYALKSVDQVVIFDEDTPYDLIKEVAPDILVKGGDWKIAQIVGADLVLASGGQVKSLSLVDGKSTTNTIKKIQENLNG